MGPGVAKGRVEFDYRPTWHAMPQAQHTVSDTYCDTRASTHAWWDGGGGDPVHEVCLGKCTIAVLF
jgi:hypothetical protein